MKTAVECLVQQLWNEGYFPYGVPEDIVEIVDKMFENQIMDAYEHGQNNGYMYRDGNSNIIQAEQYYNETFKSEQCK
jgi:hypothetical protein